MGLCLWLAFEFLLNYAQYKHSAKEWNLVLPKASHVDKYSIIGELFSSSLREYWFGIPGALDGQFPRALDKDHV